MRETDNAAVVFYQKLRTYGRDVRLYFISVALVGLCWMGIYGVLFNLYLLRLGYDLAFIGLINAAAALTYALFSLPAGAIGGRSGVRRTMIVGYGLIVAGLGLPPLAQSLSPAARTGWLLVTYSLGVAGASLYIVNAGVFLMGAISQSERSYVFSVQVALWPLTAFAGSLIGGFLPRFFASVTGASLDGSEPFRYSLLVAAGLFALGVPVLLKTREFETEEMDSEPISSATRHARRALFGLIAFLVLAQSLQSAGEGAARTFYIVYLDAGLKVPTYLIGAFTAIAQLVAVPAAFFTPQLMARWGDGPTYVRASLGTSLSLLPLALIPRLAAASMGYIGVMAMTSVWRPAIQVYRLEIVSVRRRALMNGASHMAVGLSWAGISLVGVQIVKTQGYGSVFLLGAVLTATGAALFWLFDRAPHGEFVPKVGADTAGD